MVSSQHHTNEGAQVLVLTASRKAGRRVGNRLGAKGVPIRCGSPSTQIPFEWA